MATKLLQTFDGPAGSKPDTSIWKLANDNFGLADGELQAYSPSQVYLDGDGHCVFEAVQKPYLGAQYTSGRMTTKGIFYVGPNSEIEFTGYYPLGSLIYASLLWLGAYGESYGPWPDCGEIDGSEMYGDQGAIRTTLIGPGGIIGSKLTSYNPAIMHTMKVRWSDTQIEWVLNDSGIYTITKQECGSRWVFNKPFFIVVDLALRGSGQQSFPAKMVLDTLKVNDILTTVPVPPQPGGSHMDGSQFSAKDARFSIEGSAIKAYATSASDPAWAEYSLDFGMGANSLKLDIGNFGSLNPPAGYQFDIDVKVDGQLVGNIKSAAGTQPLLNLGLINGVHTIRLLWKNDAWMAGQYDANLMIKSVNVVSNATSPGPVSGKDQAIANLKALGWSDAAINAVINP